MDDAFHAKLQFLLTAAHCVKHVPHLSSLLVRRMEEAAASRGVKLQSEVMAKVCTHCSALIGPENTSTRLKSKRKRNRKASGRVKTKCVLCLRENVIPINMITLS